MKYYIELTLLPSVDIPLYFLWEKVYGQVHLALVEMQDSEGKVAIGAAFPGYDAKQFQLGNKLRLFARATQELEKLDIGKWLSRLMDYVHISSIREVPGQVQGYAGYKRVQPKSNNARMARRKAKREGISIEQAMQALSGRKEQLSKAPFVHIKSLSSENRYRLIIASVDAERSCAGKFSTYGLSSTSTVPMF